MIRISQLKLPCGHSREELQSRVRKTLRLKEGEPLSIIIRKHSSISQRFLLIRMIDGISSSRFVQTA